VIRFDCLRLVALVAGLAIAGCSHTPPHITVYADKQGVPPRQMVVTGTATLNVSPDCADVTMTVSKISMRPREAVEDVRRRQQALVATLERLGVERGDLKLSTLGIDPRYRYTERQHAELEGYEARITITVTTHKFEQLGALMEAGADAGVTEMASRFRRSDLDVLKKKVREQALLAAQDKARQTASTLGIALGGVASVKEENASYLYSNAYFPRVANVQDTANDGQALGGELQPLTLDVTVVYDLPERG